MEKILERKQTRPEKGNRRGKKKNDHTHPSLKVSQGGKRGLEEKANRIETNGCLRCNYNYVHFRSFSKRERERGESSVVCHCFGDRNERGSVFVSFERKNNISKN
mmetsp:Transcript_17090/g.19199  ORF Transcript_17090/g.19199 Transcript_17090/m.19199 type:complete len:105 (-) Transcript_17090:2863-3177(-)